jgi:hypothetical protein
VIDNVIRKLYVYEGKEYDVTLHYDFNIDADTLIFQHEKNNWSCDCNRSLDIINNLDENFPDLGCNFKPKIRLDKMWLNGNLIYEEKLL